MEQLRQQNAQAKILSRNLRAGNNLLDTERKNQEDAINTSKLRKQKRKDSIIKDVTSLFFLNKTKIHDNIIKSIRNLFKLKKENEALKDRNN